MLDMRALITGASRGLGLALCSVLRARGDDVLAVCRTATPELRALGVQILENFDVANADAMGQLGDAVGGAPIDLVVCNAGINRSYAQGIDELDLRDVEAELGVNTLGPIRTIQAVLPKLGRGAKLALISTYRPDAGAAKRNYGYQASKMAANQLMFVLADELRARGIATLVLSPGPMNTRLLREVVEAGHARLDPAKCPDPNDVARQLVERIDALTLETSGAWLFRDGSPMSVPLAVFGH